MTVYTPPPSSDQFHAAYWRAHNELTLAYARTRAEQAAAERERNRPAPDGGAAPGQ